tara:strand:- start:20957 stop:21913 length:957 start_codon:yes stop_codon:yes gene_type:complete
MATIKSRVLQVLGENNATYIDNLTSPENIFEEGVWDMATTIPRRMLLLKATEPVDPEDIPADPGAGDYLNVQGSPMDVTNSLVLLVMRTQTDYTIADGAMTAENYITRPCKEIPYESSFKAKDASSIYYATSLSPVYWLENNSQFQRLNVAPSATGTTNIQYLCHPVTDNNGSGIQVFLYNREQWYPTSSSATAWADATGYVVGDIVSEGGKNYYCIVAHTSDLASGDADDGKPGVGTNVWRICWDFKESFDGIPEEVEDLFIQRIAMKILEHKLATLATQDEDNEVYALVKDLHATVAQNLGNIIKNLQDEKQGERE